MWKGLQIKVIAYNVWCNLINVCICAAPAAECENEMQFMECGNPCVDTCSNPQRGQVCADHCIDGCFCPEGKTDHIWSWTVTVEWARRRCVCGNLCPFTQWMLVFAGTVLDDVNHSGCIQLSSCPCSHGGSVYQSGESYSSNCRDWWVLMSAPVCGEEVTHHCFRLVLMGPWTRP